MPAPSSGQKAGRDHARPLPGRSQPPGEIGAQGTKRSFHETAALFWSRENENRNIFLWQTLQNVFWIISFLLSQIAVILKSGMTWFESQIQVSKKTSMLTFCYQNWGFVCFGGCFFLSFFKNVFKINYCLITPCTSPLEAITALTTQDNPGISARGR